jgi:amidohydrolase
LSRKRPHLIISQRTLIADPAHTLQDRDIGLAKKMIVTTSERQNGDIGKVVRDFRPDLEPFHAMYKDLHGHPELSGQESRTASIAAAHLRSLRFLVRERVGGYGVVCTFKNGLGPAILLRAEMDALPVLEKTNLPYASTLCMKDTDGQVKPVMHACGHDMHVTCLMAAATLLYSACGEWSGTLICIFQPNEEHGGGARAMIDDGLYTKGYAPVPDVVLGQHVVNIRAGYVATRTGHILAGKNVFEVRIHGRGGHGSAPHECIDPIVIAAHIVVRLQSIISRELNPNKMALITCGSLHAGDVPNIIPDEAVLKVDIRAYNPDVLAKMVSSFKRVVAAECEASGVLRYPEIREIENVPPLDGWPDVIKPITQNFKAFFGSWTEEMQADTASDDISLLAPKGVPYAYWNFGSTDHKIWEEAKNQGRLSELPGNHSAYYAPIIEPTLRAGTDAMAIAALTFLRNGDTVVNTEP